MTETIKINGGSFDVATVLSHSKLEFIERYNRLFSNWLREEQRIATLDKVYDIAVDINNKQNDGNGISQETGGTEYRQDR